VQRVSRDIPLPLRVAQMPEPSGRRARARWGGAFPVVAGTGTASLRGPAACGDSDATPLGLIVSRGQGADRGASGRLPRRRARAPSPLQEGEEERPLKLASALAIRTRSLRLGARLTATEGALQSSESTNTSCHGARARASLRGLSSSAAAATAWL
jgi:hypothetical protein